MESISDFFGAYPYPADPLFNTEIARKAEFAELTLEPRETLPVKRGGAFKHQKFAVRFLTWYDRLLLMHEPGTGKSCIIVHSAELFKREFQKNEDDPTKIRRAVILISGDTLKENIRNEIVCKCTDRIYETKEVLESEPGSAMKNNLTRVIKKWYDIMTYQDLANEIRKKQSEESLDEYMSNKVFYVDEAHNLPTLKDIARRRTPPTTIREAQELARQHETTHRQKAQRQQSRQGAQRKDKERKSPRVFGESVYETIFRAFHRGQRNKIVLATATPMINSTLGIIPLMNLILPLTEDEFPGPMPRLTEEQLNQQGPEFFEPYFRSRVLYVRSLETGVVPDPQGSPLIPDAEPEPEGYRLGQTIVYPVGMSIFQYSAYRRAYDSREAENPEQDVDENRLDAFYGDEKHASLFVYPDGSFGNAGFEKYIELVNNQYRIKQNTDGQILLANILNNLETLSAIYNENIRLCNESYPTSSVEYDADHGIIFIYFPDFNVGSGAIPFSLCLKAHGYEEFRASSDVFTSAQRTGPNLGPCSSTGEITEERGLSIDKRKRFIFLTSKTTRAQIYNYFKVLNSYENRYGEYIQVVVASRRAREGININNGVKQIMASGSWNRSRNYQARERVFRSTSHDIRLAEERAKYVQRGLNPNDVEFPLKTYNMISIYEGATPEEVAQYQADTNNYSIPAEVLEEPLFDTVGTRIYLLVEQKDIPVRRIMRIAKQSAPDCYLNRARNMRQSDIGHDFESLCDYGPCQYECFGIDPNAVGEIDYSTKILYYSSEEVKATEQAIQNLFSRFYSLKIDQIKQLMPETRPIYVDMALNNLIRNNQQILDRMGFPGYLREGPNGVIYLEKDQFEIRSHPENTAYTSALIGTQDPRNNVFSDYVTNVQFDREQADILLLREFVPGSFEFNRQLAGLSLISKVNLLEAVTERWARSRQSDDFTNAIIRAFNHAIFTYPEPVDALRRVEYDLSNQNKGRGRKPNPGSKTKRYAMKEDVRSLRQSELGEPTEKIFLHTLYNQGTHDTTNYGRMSKYQKAEGQIRILKLSEERVGWRNVNEVEYIVYNKIIQSDISDYQNRYERFPFYGIRFPGAAEMSIRDRRNEDPAQAAKDLRKRRSGKTCKFFKKHELINFLYEMRVSANVQVQPNLTREDMANYIHQQSRSRGRGGGKDQIDVATLLSYPDDQLTHLYSWYLRGDSKKDLCRIIEQRFLETDRLYTGRLPQPQQRANEAEVGSIRSGAEPTIVEYLPESESSVSTESLSQPPVEIEIDTSDNPTLENLVITLPGHIRPGTI